MTIITFNCSWFGTKNGEETELVTTGQRNSGAVQDQDHLDCSDSLTGLDHHSA